MKTAKLDTGGITDEVTLSPTEATNLLVGMYEVGLLNRVPLLCGSPGCGKTASARAAAKKLRQTRPDFHYVEVNPTMPADEVGGIPSLIHKEGLATRMDYAIPSWVPTAKENPDWEGIICLDDALQGDKLMQQNLANLVLARTLRGHDLPKGVMIVATGNRMEDKAGVTRTLTHFADRMCRINVATDPISWIENFAIPNGLRPQTIAYIGAYKDKLDMFDPDKPKCATPRTWEAVDGWLGYLDTLKAPNMDAIRNKMAQAVLGGEIGLGEATRFWAFCDKFGKLPNLDSVLKDPLNASIEYPPDIQYAIVTSLAQHVDDSDGFDAALKYIDRIGADFSTLAVKMALQTKPHLKGTKAFINWTVNNQDVAFQT